VTLNLEQKSIVTFDIFLLPTFMKFYMYVDVDEWCTTVCRV